MIIFLFCPGVFMKLFYFLTFPMFCCVSFLNAMDNNQGQMSPHFYYHLPMGRYLEQCDFLVLNILRQDYLVKGCKKVLKNEGDIGFVVSPDGNNFASVSGNITVRIWDAQHGYCVNESQIDDFIFNGYFTDKYFIPECSDCVGRRVEIKKDPIFPTLQIADLEILNTAIHSLSLRQLMFLESVRRIHEKYSCRPLVILPGTQARVSFDSLSPLVKQFLLQYGFVSLTPPLMKRAIGFVQNNWQTLMHGLIVGAMTLSYLRR